MLEVPRPFPFWSKASVSGEGTGCVQPMNFPMVGIIRSPVRTTALPGEER
jgi:hypothetical protein